MINHSHTFAIVIPAFNRESFVGSAIESALAQTVPADEIIVVDDGSTDRTAEIARSYSVPVRVISIENNGAGPSRPRNVGIQAATSQYITLLDSDDFLEPTVLERHKWIIANHPDVGLICSNYYTVAFGPDINRRRLRNEASVVQGLKKEHLADSTYRIRSNVAYRAYCGGNFIKTPATTIPKSVWKQVGGFDETLRTSNDYDFFIRILATHDIVYVDVPLHTVVYHDGNISAANLGQTFREEHYLNFIRVLMRELRSERGSQARKELRKAISTCLLDLAYGYCHAGQYNESLRTYFQAWVRAPLDLSALWGITRLPIHWLTGR
jgi:glycosyltransferase involved in cell wall biosynthesis